MIKYKTIIWDWNGTLLDDVDACVDTMNKMLHKRDMKLLDADRYKQIFTFPVQNYYKSIGFDFNKESFEDLSVEYIDMYMKESKHSPLHNGTINVLNHFKTNGIDQVILSAAEQTALETQVKDRQIEDYFGELIGLSDIYAKSKTQNAIDFIKRAGISAKNICLIGDTKHDFEVANEIGCECVLINNGHQELSKNGHQVKVINNIKELLN